jgi:hypothetical protein
VSVSPPGQRAKRGRARERGLGYEESYRAKDLFTEFQSGCRWWITRKGVPETGCAVMALHFILPLPLPSAKSKDHVGCERFQFHGHDNAQCCVGTSVSSVTSGFGIQFPISGRKPYHDGCRPGRFGSQARSGIRFREKPSPAPPEPRVMGKYK